MSKHTQGPWFVHSATDNDSFIVFDISIDDITVCGVYAVTDEDFEAAKWDAKLIAAAPEMLEALTQLSKYSKDALPDGVPEMIQSAILKATT